MFFKKRKNEDFELKTEDEDIKNDYYDEDFFRYEDDDDSFIIEPYKAERVIKNNNDSIENEEEPVVNNTYVYEEEPVVNNTYVYEEEEPVVNNTYIYEKEEHEKNSNKKRISFHLSERLLYILNRIASVVLIITIVIAVMILFDVIMLTRFEKGPFFAIKTKTYNDGGTKVYHGIGYKVIKYNVDGGRHDMVVGDYSITYSK